MQLFRNSAICLPLCLAALLGRGEVNLSTLASFEGTNGANPAAGLVLAADGNFYGTTRIGGAFNLGTVFQITPSGVLTSLGSFAATNGAYPKAALAQTTNGGVLLYGTTSSGGASNRGTVFRITPTGVMTTLVAFAGPNGDSPQSGLILASDGRFRGTTYYGGTNDWPAGYGTVFQLTTNGQITTEVSFDNDNGAGPYASVIQGAEGHFYGTTQVGGTSGLGTVFQLTATGGITPLVSFNSTNGAFPLARLIAVGGGTFYGTTYSGGGSNLGTVFRVTTNGNLTTLVSFTGMNGARPFGGLVLAGDGHLYGSTAQGGAAGLGTVYQMTTNGALTSLVSFAGLNGDFPYGELVLDGGGNLYGTTANGGATGGGTVFRLSSAPPAPPVFQSINHSGNLVGLSWSATIGKIYQLQFKTNLDQVVWINLGGLIPATNTVMTGLDTSGAESQRFYRMVLLP